MSKEQKIAYSARRHRHKYIRRWPSKTCRRNDEQHGRSKKTFFFFILSSAAQFSLPFLFTSNIYCGSLTSGLPSFSQVGGRPATKRDAQEITFLGLFFSLPYSTVSLQRRKRVYKWKQRTEPALLKAPLNSISKKTTSKAKTKKKKGQREKERKQKKERARKKGLLGVTLWLLYVGGDSFNLAPKNCTV